MMMCRAGFARTERAPGSGRMALLRFGLWWYKAGCDVVGFSAPGI